LLSSSSTVYTVEGMSCAHCERAVTEEVAAVDGVTAVSADAAAGTVTVTAAGLIDESAIAAAVAEAGYALAGRA
jgi:copper chaperone CopZ